MGKKFTEQEKKKIEVAKDVLANLEMKKLHLDPRFYCTIWQDNSLEDTLTDKKNENKELQKFIPQIREGCQVCAVGAFFLSQVDVFDKLKIKKIISKYKGIHGNEEREICLNNRDMMAAKLREVFPDKEVDLIETAFMQDRYVKFDKYVYDEMGRESRQKAPKEYVLAERFGKKFKNDENLLKAICENIIRYGSFKPEKAFQKKKVKV